MPKVYGHHTRVKQYNGFDLACIALKKLPLELQRSTLAGTGNGLLYFIRFVFLLCISFPRFLLRLFSVWCAYGVLAIRFLAGSQFSAFPELAQTTAPKLPRWLVLSFKCLYTLRTLGVPPRVLSPLYQRLHHQALRACHDAPDLSASPLQVEALSNKASEEDCRKALSKAFHELRPIILKGRATSVEATRKWSADFFVREYGDVRVAASKQKFEYSETQPLRRMEVDEGFYVQNCESIFRKCPELEKDLEIPYLQTLAKGCPMVYTYTHLFVGKSGKGSPFHCAPVWNIFMQFEGRKKWTWVHPENYIFMYANSNTAWSFTPMTSALDFASSRDTRTFPLYKYCPRYEAILEPGDIMLNPPWWWHTITNLDGPSTAVATRWLEQSFLSRAQLFFATKLLFSFNVPALLFTSCAMNGAYVPPDDDEITLREQVTRYNDFDRRWNF